MRKGIRLLLIPIITMLLSHSLEAQFTYNSPYSRFGIGDLYQISNGTNGAMGGLKYVVNGPFLVNPSNPASYTAFKKNYFTFDAGLGGTMARLSTTNLVRDETQFNLNNLAFGIPLGNKWGGALGLVPYTSVGYSISELGFNKDFGGYKTTYEGSGGLNRVFAGVAYKTFKNLSVGVNADFIFGSLNYARIVSFDSTNFLNLNSKKSRIINDMAFHTGVQYTHTLNEEKETHLLLGLAFTPRVKLSGHEDIVTHTFRYGGSNQILSKDTIENIQKAKGHIIMPMQVAGGISLVRSERWMAGIEAEWQNWTNFTAFDIQDSLKPSFQIAIGGEYKINTVLLRGGIRHNMTYLEARSNKLTETGISFGVGLPVYNKNYSISHISLGIEAGTRGTTKQGLIKENFGKLWLNFTMSQERWFKRREYN